MKEAGMEITKANYFHWVFGDPNYKPDAEQEMSDVPPEWREHYGPDGWPTGVTTKGKR